MKVLVTGAAGFVGAAAVSRLALEHSVVAAVRSMPRKCSAAVQYAPNLDLERVDGWDDALQGVQTIVHCAARVHQLRGPAAAEMSEYRRINVAATTALAARAAANGAKRFIFISSIKVHGNRSDPGRPFRRDEARRPQDSYALSKLEAEKRLCEVGKATGMEIVIVRPPLVYGPGVGANFLALMRLVWHGVPLPLASVEAKRSLVFVNNLADLIAVTVVHDAAAGGVFLVSDGYDLAVPEMIRELGTALGRPARLFPVAPKVLDSLARLIGRGDVVERLLQSLQVDLAETRQQLNWQPPVAVQDALRRTAEHFKDCQS